MSPGVVADLEAHLVKLSNFAPCHEIRGVVHPSMRDEEGCVEAEFAKVRTNKRASGFHRIVESQHHSFLRLERKRGGERDERTSRKRHGNDHTAASADAKRAGGSSPPALCYF